MTRYTMRQRALFTPIQLFIIFILLFGFLITIDFRRRGNPGSSIQLGRMALQAEVDLALREQEELLAAQAYVWSDDFLERELRNRGYIKEGDTPVSPIIQSTINFSVNEPLVEEIAYAEPRPWQGWWRLLSDRPLPTR